MLKRRLQEGFNLVELMIGTTVGMIVMAGLMQLFSAFLTSNKSMLAASRLAQDVRMVVDVVSRDLRRSGYWQNYSQGLYNGTSYTPNPYAAVTTSPSAQYSYALDTNNTVDANETFGFKLQNNAVMMLRGGAWVPMTDSNVIRVNTFTVTPTVRTVSLAAYCSTTCATGSTTCPPQQQIRGYDIAISASLVSDSTVTRSLTETVKVRNDSITGTCS